MEHGPRMSDAMRHSQHMWAAAAGMSEWIPPATPECVPVGLRLVMVLVQPLVGQFPF